MYAKPTLINLYPNEHSQEFHHYPFLVNLDRCARSYNTLDDLSNKVCVPNETEDLNFHVFNMIIEINESRTLAKHISCKCELKLYGKKFNLNQKQNNSKCRCECKNSKEHQCGKGYFWNPAKYRRKNGKYSGGTANSVITSDEIIEEAKSTLTKTIPTKCTLTNFYIFPSFLLTTIALLIPIST